MGGNLSRTQGSIAGTVGRLAVYLVRDPTVWAGGVSAGDRYLLDFTGLDWDSLFVEILDCPEPEVYVDDEDLNEYVKRQRSRFCESLPDYPMLCRIWDLYADVSYTVEEVDPLRAECQSILSMTFHRNGIRALRKLLLTCDQALAYNSGIFMVSD
jgi:hypothetical protein